MENKELRATWKEVPIQLLEQHENNPRAISNRKMTQLIESLKEDPDLLYSNPIVVRIDEKDNLIVIGGNMRLEACKRLGYKNVPCSVVDIDRETAIRWMIKMNTHYGYFDTEHLANFGIDPETLESWGVSQSVINGFQEFGEGGQIDLSSLETIFSIVDAKDSPYGATAKKQIQIVFQFMDEKGYGYVIEVLKKMCDRENINEIEALIKLCEDYERRTE